MDEKKDLRELRIEDALIEFERRIRAATLSADSSECQALLKQQGQKETEPAPLAYISRLGPSMLRIASRNGHNKFCLSCELFGKMHCCGGLAFLFYVLKEMGQEKPEELLCDPVDEAAGLYLPDWDKMEANLPLILSLLRAYWQRHRDRIDDKGEGGFF